MLLQLLQGQRARHTHTDPLSISLISGLILRGVRTSRGHPETDGSSARGREDSV